MTRAELIAALERATESSFALNQAIARLDFYREQHGDYADNEVPDFMGSIDAALTLVPEGFQEVRLQIGVGDAIYCNAVVMGDTFTEENTYIAPGRTAPLALCIAALKASERTP